MTQEDKQLLLKDLSARLPYGVKIRMIHHEIKGADPEYVDDVFSTTHYNMIDYDDDNYEFLPYLRPMSSMTEEESAELSNIISEWFDKELFYLTEEPFLEYALSKINYSISPLLFDWLNAHHFNYRGLIEKGLAIEAPEDMYNEEQ